MRRPAPRRSTNFARDAALDEGYPPPPPPPPSSSSCSLKALNLRERDFRLGIAAVRDCSTSRGSLYEGGEGGSMLTIKRNPTIKILYLLMSERRNKGREIKGESAAAWWSEREKGPGSCCPHNNWLGRSEDSVLLPSLGTHAH